MANMRLRCIHSCMVLTVVGLLLIYSAFLTGPSYLDSTLDSGGGGNAGGEATGPPGQAQQSNGGPPVSSKLVLSASNLINAGDIQNEIGGGGGRGHGPSSGQSGDFGINAFEDNSLINSNGGKGSQSLLTASSVFPDAQSSNNPGEISQQIAAALLQQQGSGSAPSGDSASSILPTLTQTIHDIVLKKKLESQQSLARGRLGTGKGQVIWTRDIYEPGFQYPNAGVCPNDGLDIRLIILITSAPSHFSARDAIRLTWGHYAQRLDVSMAFIVGKSENETILDGLENEKRLYDDLIVANFMDSYDNLTLKTMATLEWIDTYCNQSEFVLKTDDDMFINVPNLLKFIDRIEPEDKKRPKLYGRLARKWKPVRNKRSKYYISFQQYKKTVYPDFNTGPAYLFSTRIVRPLFEKGMEKTYLKLEDVYTTGILAEELAIKRMNIADFANKKVNFHKTGFCALSKLISMHMVAYHEQFELWKKILDGRTKCKIIYTSAAKTAEQKKQLLAQQQKQGDNKNSHSESNSQVNSNNLINNSISNLSNSSSSSPSNLVNSNNSLNNIQLTGGTGTGSASIVGTGTATATVTASGQSLINNSNSLSSPVVSDTSSGATAGGNVETVEPQHMLSKKK